MPRWRRWREGYPMISIPGVAVPTSFSSVWPEELSFETSLSYSSYDTRKKKRRSEKHNLTEMGIRRQKLESQSVEDEALDVKPLDYQDVDTGYFTYWYHAPKMRTTRCQCHLWQKRGTPLSNADWAKRRGLVFLPSITGKALCEHIYPSRARGGYLVLSENQVSTHLVRERLLRKAAIRWVHSRQVCLV